VADFKQIAKNSLASQGTLEMEWLLNKVSIIKPKVIVEIGVHLGHSMKAWQDAFDPEILVGIDNERNETLDTYLENGDLIAYFIDEDSHDPKTGEQLVNEVLKGRWVDFLFLDGDHTLAGVKRDYEMYGPLVRPGGVIAFHDAVIEDHPLVEVYKLLRTIKRHIEVYQADANGIGLLYV
jgi:cephalosporin hydroxylase